MPEYAFEALTETGEVTRGVLDAETELELEKVLRERGSWLIRAERRDGRPGEPARRRERKRTDAPMPRAELVAFTEYLSGAISAGIPIFTILEDVEGHLRSRKLRRIVQEIRESMAEEGKALSEALAEHPRTFSQLYIGTVEAGEASGQLDYSLGQLVDYLDWQEEMASQLRQATLYPAIVIMAVVVLIMFLLGFVYPRLLPVLDNFDVELPLPTRIVMAAAYFTQQWWWAALLGFGLLLLLPVAARRHPRGRRVVDRMALRLPVFGRLIWEMQVTRFVTYLALFYRTGVELIHGLSLVERMITNSVIADGVAAARRSVVGGETLAHAFAQTGLFPSIVLRSMALGESTGGLDEALGRAKAYYDREVPATIRRMLTALQPALIVVLGGIIMLVALSIFLPILSIYQSVGR